MSATDPRTVRQVLALRARLGEVRSVVTELRDALEEAGMAAETTLVADAEAKLVTAVANVEARVDRATNRPGWSMNDEA